MRMVLSAIPNSSRCGPQAAEVLVDVGDHAVEAGALFVRSGVAVLLDVVRRDVERPVRRVGGDVTEEGLRRRFLR